MALLIIIVAAALGLIAALLLRRVHPPRWLAALGLILLVGGILLVNRDIDRIIDTLGRLHSWPDAQGTVVTSRIVGERAFHVELIYRYEVAGVTYLDTTAIEQPSFGGKNKRYDVAREILSEHPPGSSLEVLYNPKEPHISTIEKSVFWALYAQTGFGAFLTAVGCCLILMILLTGFGRRKQLA